MDGALAISQLSGRAGVGNNTLSPLLKRMASFEIISRERDAEDERRVVIALTEQGRTALTAARAVVGQGFAELDLAPGDVRRATGFMDEVQAKLEQANPPKLTMAALLGETD